MKNPILAVLAIAVTFTLMQPANAQSGYIGFSFGQTENDDACGSGPVFTVTSCDDKDTGLTVYGGYNFHENFAVEGGYINFGESAYAITESSATVPLNNRATITVKDEAWSLFGAGVGKITVGERVTLFGKAGLHRWTADSTLSSGNSIGLDDDGVDLFYGVGGEVSLPNDKFKIRLEYQIFKFKDAFEGAAFAVDDDPDSAPAARAYQSAGSDTDVKFLSLGLTYAF